MAYVAAFTAAIGALPTVESIVVAAISVLLIASIQAVRRRYGPGYTYHQDYSADDRLRHNGD